jgi:hypothetical protein
MTEANPPVARTQRSSSCARRKHKAPMTRILAAGVSATVTMGLVSAMSRAEQPLEEPEAAIAPTGISAQIVDAIAGQAPPAPPDVIRIEIHRKVYVPAPARASPDPAPSARTNGATRRVPVPAAPARTSRSNAS